MFVIEEIFKLSVLVEASIPNCPPVFIPRNEDLNLLLVDPSDAQSEGALVVHRLIPQILLVEVSRIVLFHLFCG